MRKVRIIKNGQVHEIDVHGEVIQLPKGVTAKDFIDATNGNHWTTSDEEWEAQVGGRKSASEARFYQHKWQREDSPSPERVPFEEDFQPDVLRRAGGQYVLIFDYEIEGTFTPNGTT